MDRLPSHHSVGHYQESGPVTLEFNCITYHVMCKAESQGKKTKQILHGISGSCSSGRLVALMGPSGAGKTSLLDILAGVKVNGTSRGTVLINGAPRSSKHMSGYVQQRDILMPSATVREALTTSALLKLPYSMSKAQKLQRVEELLDALELRKVADTLIGDEAVGVKGISGGEKRRTSVGIELIQDPKIVFLDEPTTGLDSKMALDVMTVLHKLAASGKMVVCTIHQPNSDITDLFDDWMLLAEGRLLYAGPWTDALSHFEAIGYPCPPFKSPADFFMTLASDKANVKTLADRFQPLSNTNSHRALIAADKDVSIDCWPASGGSFSSQSQLGEEQGGCLPCCPWSSDPAPTRNTPAWYQTTVLMQRFLRSWWRTPVLTLAEAAQYIILGLFLGLLYLQSPLKLPYGPPDRIGAISLGLVLLIFIPSYTSVIVWDYERRMLSRESQSGMYNRGAFFVAKTVVTTLMEIVLVSLFAVITYFMVGYQRDPLKFLIYWATLQLVALAAETVGILCMLVTKDAKVGVELVTVVLVFMMAFSGFLVKNIPVYFRWIGKMSFFTYASDILITNEFKGLQFAVAGEPGFPPGLTSVDAMELIPSAMHTGLSLRDNMGVLVGITFGMRVLAWLMLEVVAKFRLL